MMPFIIMMIACLISFIYACAAYKSDCSAEEFWGIISKVFLTAACIVYIYLQI